MLAGRRISPRYRVKSPDFSRSPVFRKGKADDRNRHARFGKLLLEKFRRRGTEAVAFADQKLHGKRISIRIIITCLFQLCNRYRNIFIDVKSL